MKGSNCTMHPVCQVLMLLNQTWLLRTVFQKCSGLPSKTEIHHLHLVVWEDGCSHREYERPFVDRNPWRHSSGVVPNREPSYC